METEYEMSSRPIYTGKKNSKNIWGIVVYETLISIIFVFFSY